MKKGGLFFMAFLLVSGCLFLTENPAWAQTCGRVMPASTYHLLVFGNVAWNIEYGRITAGANPREEKVPLEMARRFRRFNPLLLVSRKK